MKKSRYSEEQIIGILKQSEAGRENSGPLPRTWDQRGTLDGLLETRRGSPYSTLSWLRLLAGAPAPKAVMAHIERLQTLRNLGFHPNFRRGFIRTGSFRLPAKVPSARSINSKSASQTGAMERWLRYC